MSDNDPSHRHRASDPGVLLSQLGQVTWVHCPSCDGPAKNRAVGVRCIRCGYTTIQQVASPPVRWASKPPRNCARWPSRATAAAKEAAREAERVRVTTKYVRTSVLNTANQHTSSTQVMVICATIPGHIPHHRDADVIANAAWMNQKNQKTMTLERVV